MPSTATTVEKAQQLPIQDNNHKQQCYKKLYYIIVEKYNIYNLG